MMELGLAARRGASEGAPGTRHSHVSERSRDQVVERGGTADEPSDNSGAQKPGIKRDQIEHGDADEGKHLASRVPDRGTGETGILAGIGTNDDGREQ